MTASPVPIITIPQSIFPTYPEQHPTTWELTQAMSSPLLPLTTGREPSSSPILVTVPSPMTETRPQPSYKAQLFPPEFLHNCFPLTDEAHAQKREALERVMTADWKIRNQMEPHECHLLDFMRLDSQRNRWICTFYNGGIPCGSSYKKKDQAKGHIRFHLQHFPYACLDAGPWCVRPPLLLALRLMHISTVLSSPNCVASAIALPNRDRNTAPSRPDVYPGTFSSPRSRGSMSCELTLPPQQ